MPNRYPLVLNGSTIQELQSGDAVAGLVIGTDVQAYDADLDAIAALAGTSGVLKKTAANTWTLDTSTFLTSSAIGTTVQAYDADLAAFAAKTAPTGDVVGTSDTQTLTNKTIAIGSNTVSGTLAQFNSAVTDADLASLAGAETLTNKTLVDPTITGTIIEDIFTITDGAAFEIDPANGSIQLITLGANRTPKATNFVNGEAVTLMVDDGTARTLTWTDSTFGGSGVIWETNGGAAPTLATSGYTVITLWKVAGQVYGARVGDA